jgi:hypothetical protein
MRRAIAALLLFAAPAQAQMVCNFGPDMLAELADKHGEHPLATGSGQSGLPIIVTLNEATGSWSILVAMPDGKTCLAAAGTDWKMLPQGAFDNEGEPKC